FPLALGGLGLAGLLGIVLWLLFFQPRDPQEFGGVAIAAALPGDFKKPMGRDRDKPAADKPKDKEPDPAVSDPKKPDPVKPKDSEPMKVDPLKDPTKTKDKDPVKVDPKKP